MPIAQLSEYRIEKARVEAIVTMSNGDSVEGCFFVSSNSPRHDGPERVGDLLNSDTGFLPFERHDGEGVRSVIYNRDHLFVVALRDPEANHEPGYEVATPRIVSVLLANGQRIVGSIRVFRPERRDRVSDWARFGKRFRYIETDGTTYLVNLDHVIEVCEVEAA